jgi:hypothetical protein
LILLAPDLVRFVSDEGVLRGEEAKQLAGPLRYSVLQDFQTPGAVRVVFAITTTAAVLTGVGLWTRVTSFVLYLGLLSLHHRNLLTNSGADTILVILSFLLAMAPSGRAYSFDARREARRRGGAAAEAIVSIWPLRLIQLQISVVYFMTALLKARGESWSNGTAIHHVLSNGEVRRFTFGLLENEIAVNVLTLGALVAEFALAFLLWSRAARPVVMALGVSLHLGIMLTVNIPVFGELMMASYFVFLTPSEFHAIGRAVDPRRWFGFLERSAPEESSSGPRSAPPPKGLRLSGTRRTEDEVHEVAATQRRRRG